MAFTCWETPKSRAQSKDSKKGRCTLLLAGQRTFSESEAYNGFIAASPLSFDGLPRELIKTDPQGGGFWLATIEYGTPDAGQSSSSPPSADTPLGGEFSFDTAGGTLHITQSLETIDAVGVNIPETKRAIGVSKDHVDGCDVTAPKLEFSISWYRPTLTLRYIKQLKDCTGKVNSESFLEFDPGELLFLGGTGAHKSQGDPSQPLVGEMWKITGKFAAAENETQVDITPDITFASKDGWDYVWVGYNQKAVVNNLLLVPDFAKIERVYKRLAFKDFLEFG